MALALQGKHSEAIPAYEQAIGSEPNLPGGHFNLAVALEQTGSLAEAKKHYEMALRQDPADLEARSALQRLGSK